MELKIKLLVCLRDLNNIQNEFDLEKKKKKKNKKKNKKKKKKKNQKKLTNIALNHVFLYLLCFSLRYLNFKRKSLL